MQKNQFLLLKKLKNTSSAQPCSEDTDTPCGEHCVGQVKPLLPPAGVVDQGLVREGPADLLASARPHGGKQSLTRLEAMAVLL